MSAADLGQWVRLLRNRQGMSLRELADMAGISAAYLSQLESGERDNPSFDVALSLAAALGVSVQDLGQDYPREEAEG